jgi:hypothetical protein
MQPSFNLLEVIMQCVYTICIGHTPFTSLDYLYYPFPCLMFPTIPLRMHNTNRTKHCVSISLFIEFKRSTLCF